MKCEHMLFKNIDTSTYISKLLILTHIALVFMCLLATKASYNQGFNALFRQTLKFLGAWGKDVFILITPISSSTVFLAI